MIGALWTGISGLAGSQAALDNESNNIANVNTVGYKASRISFADQMYQNDIGKGTQIMDAEKLYKQGNLKLTGVDYDLALAGDGFFAVSNTRAGGTSETYYTRAGSFGQGDSGTLQDQAGNDVQGWAMASDPAVETSNPNVDYFTNDYNKMLSSQIVKYSNSVETITAKATDYTLTAKDDNPTVFTGAGLKTKSSKISDVEELVKAYDSALQNLKNDPNSSSANAKSQISHIDLPDTGDASAISQDGDEVYVYIDGNRISQSYITGDDADDGYRKTMKALSDKINKIPGIKSYTATTDPYTPSTADGDVNSGILRIESLVPGDSFTISSCGMVHNGDDKPGTFGTDAVADPGKGAGALDSIRNALDMAVTGKQEDVYTAEDLQITDNANTYTYQITIYNKELGKNVIVPTNPITIDKGDATDTDTLDINDFVSAINGDDDLNNYIKAENINGVLVVKTLDSNFDVEYSSDMIRTDTDPDVDLKRNADYSGREGAGAEFMEIRTTIDQSGSQGSLQLRLDTLGISDSAFGDFNVDDTGLITMSQDGAMYAVGQVAVAKFVSNRGLEPVGDNLLKSTLASGDPIYNTNNDKTADIKSSTVELSTADLSESLVNLMVFQRAFEANSKSITTADSILNTLIQLKR
jgi:flagellar hook protein FlgE